ncbi:hypothetical protein BHM03_00044759 [Ensete ventricosum]|nr:hypothetical protein BHM03_00044759 [Ensete ventricosum]
MKLQLDDGPRSSLSIGPGFGRCSRISPKFARRFAEGIGKLAGRSLEEDQKTRHKNTGGRRIGGSKPSVSDGCTIVAPAFRLLTTTDPPKLGD